MVTVKGKGTKSSFCALEYKSSVRANQRFATHARTSARRGTCSAKVRIKLLCKSRICIIFDDRSGFHPDAMLRFVSKASPSVSASPCPEGYKSKICSRCITFGEEVHGYQIYDLYPPQTNLRFVPEGEQSKALQSLSRSNLRFVSGPHDLSGQGVEIGDLFAKCCLQI